MSDDSRGWVKLWRKWQDHEMSRDPNATIVFLHLLTRCRHKPQQNRRFGYTLEPGQCDETQDQLADAAGLTRNQVREAMTRLLRYGTIKVTQHNHQRRNLITLVNWAVYSGDESTTTKETTNEPPTNHQRTTNPEELENGENGKKTTPRKRGVSKRVNPETTPIPDDLQDQAVPLRRWLLFKAERGQGYTPMGVEGVFKKCRELGAGFAAAVETSIAANWAGIFPPKGNGQAKPPTTYDFVDGVAQ